MGRFDYRFDDNPLLGVEDDKIIYGLRDDEWFKPESITQIESIYHESGKLYIIGQGRIEFWHFIYDDTFPYRFIRFEGMIKPY